jgi:hypothetical protein
MIIVCAVPPAVVSYYWSAALQRGAPSVRTAAQEPSLFGTGVMFYGIALLGVVSFAAANLMAGIGSSGQQSNGFFLLF